MQIAGEGKKGKRITVTQTIRSLLEKEGMWAIYTGLSAGLLRQATYTTTRLAVYTWLFEMFRGPNGEKPSFLTKTVIGMVAGLAGAFAGTPSDIALIRMTADGSLPAEKRRKYRNIFNALVRIRKEEGVQVLWRGAVPTMGRAMIVNVAQLVTYSEAKDRIIRNGIIEKDGLPAQFTASMISGLVTTVASMPIDLVKTRLQNMVGNEYKGSIDAFVKVVRNEGFFALWKGFLPYYARQAPATVLMFLFLEQLNICYLRHVLGLDHKSDKR